MPPLSSSSFAKVSPLILFAFSKNPFLKLKVGKAPASFTILVSTFVPNFGKASPVTECFLKPSRNFLLASLNFSGFFGSLRFVPSGSRIIALTPFAPITAPIPPLPACLVGLNSGSVTATDAADILYSPATPIEIRATLSPYSFFIFSAVS